MYNFHGFIIMSIRTEDLCLHFSVFLEWTHKCFLLLHSLEAAMTKFAACVDELEFDLFTSNTLGLNHE